MSMKTDGPATLAFVTRPVTGKIATVRTKFDTKLRENKQESVDVENPVIVFYPNRTSQVMSGKEAERRGYMEQPEILNFDSVTDQTSTAGRYKFAMHLKQRLDAWQQMEDAVVNGCISKSGHPFDQDTNYSKQTMMLAQFKENVA